MPPKKTDGDALWSSEGAETAETDKDSSAEENPFAAVIADAVAGTGAQQEMWLFLNSVPSTTGIRRYAAKYELISVGLVIILLVEDIVFSVKEVSVLAKGPFTKWFEYLAYAIFTTEYLARVWSCMASKALNPQGSCRSAVFGRMKFGVGGLLLVDFLVLGAFYMQLYMNFISSPDGKSLQGLQVLRMFRAFRAFRSAKMLKVDRKANALGALLKVLEAEVTPIMATLTIAFMLVIILATLMYYIENSAQPEAYSSIPAAMWWSVTALTSVGYGDVYPITVPGKLLGCMACVVGAGIIALPTGILSNGFNEEICLAADEKEAEQIEERVEATMVELEALCQEIKCLDASFDEIDVSQRCLLRALRQRFPERVLQILGPEKEEPLEEAAFTAEEASPHLSESDLASLREKVERDVTEMLTKKRQRLIPGGVFMRSGLGLTASSSS